MNKKLRFIAGLPRSGSTLLCNLLCQNPAFRATHTSGCLDVLFATRNHWDSLAEHKSHPLPEAKLNVLRAILNAYHSEYPQPVIFDKCRGWLSHLEMLENLMGEKAKVLVCVRSIPDVLSSMEKLNRATAKIKQPPGEAQNYAQFQTIEGRCDYWMRADALVGTALNRVRDALHRGFGDRMHFIDYEHLTAYPDRTMQRVYQFLEEPVYQHNFDDVAQITEEDDEVHGYVNLHKIHPKVVSRPSDAVSVLGPNLVKKYKQFDILV